VALLNNLAELEQFLQFAFSSPVIKCVESQPQEGDCYIPTPQINRYNTGNNPDFSYIYILVGGFNLRCIAPSN
jgi:hypothetical protein